MSLVCCFTRRSTRRAISARRLRPLAPSPRLIDPGVRVATPPATLSSIPEEQMRRVFIAGSFAAAVLSLATVTTAGQATPQTPTQSPVQSGAQGAGAPGARTPDPATSRGNTPGTPASPLTLVGCIERGANGEFMLMSASAGSSTAP